MGLDQTLAETPRSCRLHISLFGRRNTGKSSLLNAITDQEAAIVSDAPGTTTDPVAKAMEVPGIGPVLFTDTAGYDDDSELGGQRVEKTGYTAEHTDLALFLTDADPPDTDPAFLRSLGDTPVVLVLAKADLLSPRELAEAKTLLAERFGRAPLAVSARTGAGLPGLLAALAKNAPDGWDSRSILGPLVRPGYLAVLAIPQDNQAPRGRLAVPQVLVLRELTDRGCVAVTIGSGSIGPALAALTRPPDLVVADATVLEQVAPQVPEGVPLSSFSLLMAGLKGDLTVLRRGLAGLARLTGRSRVLIAEACTHEPREQDLGRVRIPGLLRARFGEGLSVDFVRGLDFPADLTPYDLVIHCGGCMFNRAYLLSRIARAVRQNVPITEYDQAQAWLLGLAGRLACAY
jgi:[FeFe] hydrogenase H-cluster maturation GTPase HydF